MKMILFKTAIYLFSVSLVICFDPPRHSEGNLTCRIETVCKLPSRSVTGRQKGMEQITTEHSNIVSSEENFCYPWMYRNETSGACECSDIPNGAVLCDPTIPRTSILDCYCMTYNSERNETELGRCLHGCGRQVYTKLPQSVFDLNFFSCGNVHKDSPLCGKCKPGYSPLVYSYNMSCMNCTGMTYNWIKYIAVAYVPLTFFFLFVVTFRFSGTSPLMRGFITVCQAFSSPICLRAYMAVVTKGSFTEVALKIVSTLYGIWNLDFFRTILPPICLDINPLQALALDYAIAFYPLFLVTVTYILIRLHSRDVRIVVWLWKPFHKLCSSIKREWDFEGSIIQAFATFFMLSYLKILNTTSDLLVYSEQYIMPHGERGYRVRYSLYFDPSVEYFRREHLYYGIAAVAVGVLTVFFPLVFLVIYPMHCFQKCLNCFKLKRQSIDMYVTCYQGYYKDGTNGTKNFRYFSIVFFVLQIVIFGVFTLSKSIFTYSVAAIIALLYMFALLVVQPYKEQFKSYSTIDAFMLLAVVLTFIMTVATDEAQIKDKALSIPSEIIFGVIQLIPFFYLCGLIVWWIIAKKKLKQKKFRFCGSNQTEIIEDIPDRVENPTSYESQAALLVDMSQFYTQQSDFNHSTTQTVY